MLKISIEFKDTVHQVSADVSTIGGFHCLMSFCDMKEGLKRSLSISLLDQ